MLWHIVHRRRWFHAATRIEAEILHHPLGAKLRVTTISPALVIGDAFGFYEKLIERFVESVTHEAGESVRVAAG